MDFPTINADGTRVQYMGKSLESGPGTRNIVISQPAIQTLLEKIYVVTNDSMYIESTKIVWLVLVCMKYRIVGGWNELVDFIKLILAFPIVCRSILMHFHESRKHSQSVEITVE